MPTNPKQSLTLFAVFFPYSQVVKVQTVLLNLELLLQQPIKDAVTLDKAGAVDDKVGREFCPIGEHNSIRGEFVNRTFRSIGENMANIINAFFGEV